MASLTSHYLLVIVRDLTVPPGKTASHCPSGWLYPGPEGKELSLGKGRIGGLN